MLRIRALRENEKFGEILRLLFWKFELRYPIQKRENAINDVDLFYKVGSSIKDFLRNKKLMISP